MAARTPSWQEQQLPLGQQQICLCINSNNSITARATAPLDDEHQGQQHMHVHTHKQTYHMFVFACTLANISYVWARKPACEPCKLKLMSQLAKLANLCCEWVHDKWKPLRYDFWRGYGFKDGAESMILSDSQRRPLRAWYSQRGHCCHCHHCRCHHQCHHLNCCRHCSHPCRYQCQTIPTTTVASAAAIVATFSAAAFSWLLFSATCWEYDTLSASWEYHTLAGGT